MELNPCRHPTHQVDWLPLPNLRLRPVLRAANVITKPVAMLPSLFHIDQDEIIQGRSPPGTGFRNVGGAIDIYAELSHDLGTQLAPRVRSVDQQHSLLFKFSRDRRGERQDRKRGVHAETDLGCARTEVSRDLRFAAALLSSSRVRFRRAIFLRSRLSLDLSPFRADMVNS